MMFTTRKQVIQCLVNECDEAFQDAFFQGEAVSDDLAAAYMMGGEI